VTFDGTGIRAKTMRLGVRGRGAMNQMVPWAVSQTIQPVVSAQIAAYQARTAAPTRPGFPHRAGMASLAPDLAALDVTQTLGDWRVWAPYARVIMTDADYSAMPSPNRTALRNWVAFGGELYLAPSTGGGRREQQRLGAGTIHRLSLPVTATSYGDSGLFDGPSLLETTFAVPSTNEISLQKSGLSQKIPPAKRVGDWMVYFFIGFALLVGPVNLFVLAPVKRRQRLFLTVPAISLAAVALLIVAIWLQDGVGGEGARRAFVVLLPGDNQAAVFQEQVSRSGLLFGTKFSLPEDTVCATVPTDDYGQGNRAFTFQREENTASGDWFRSRARQAQHLRRLVPTRGRVEQVGTAPDGAPIVQSSVGTTLRDFRLTDAAGVWEAREVPPGTRVTLARSTAKEEIARQVELFGTPCSTHFLRLVRSCATPEPGRFVASASDFDLAPLGTLAGIRWGTSAILITGLLDTAGSRSQSP
jgi:hypothetical protein